MNATKDRLKRIFYACNDSCLDSRHGEESLQVFVRAVFSTLAEK